MEHGSSKAKAEFSATCKKLGWKTAMRSESLFTSFTVRAFCTGLPNFALPPISSVEDIGEVNAKFAQQPAGNAPVYCSLVPWVHLGVEVPTAGLVFADRPQYIEGFEVRYVAPGGDCSVAYSESIPEVGG